MGVNWAAGLIRWKPHIGADGTPYPLHHLHPFRMPYELPENPAHPTRTLHLHVAFGLHTFTRRPIGGENPDDWYSDNRETRVFDPDRYRLSFALPNIARELDRRPCQFARAQSGNINYVTVDLGRGVRYGVFFDLQRWRERGPDAVLLMVQSAYELDARKGEPGKGRITLKALLGHAIRGTKPKRPP